ncbi:MAG: NAD-dependent epimerase/dehydratase family protein, partial [bacterium]
MKNPNLINNIYELNQFMTRPSDMVVNAVRNMPGDLMILGAGGKMGISLALLANRAAEQAGKNKRIIAVSRFTNKENHKRLSEAGIKTYVCNLLDEGALENLPSIENVVYMVGMKFGTTGREAETWAINTFLPGLIARKFKDSRIILFSTGNVYPLVSLKSGGCSESHPTAPVGEYAQSALGRERIFEYFSKNLKIKGVILRLNYAIDLQYGVLLDVAQKVFHQRPINLTMGYVNVIWQGDVHAIVLKSFEFSQSPPFILNVTGPEIISIREIAEHFGKL